MTQTAIGTFEINLTPHPLHEAMSDPLLGRMAIDKQFAGDLVGSSVGEMLSARTAVPSSAGYVAIERVTGTLAGRSGSFVLQHNGTMGGGAFGLTVTVVADSGTDGLTGLSGSMNIENADGQHSYTFAYTLPDASA